MQSISRHAHAVRGAIFILCLFGIAAWAAVGFAMFRSGDSFDMLMSSLHMIGAYVVMGLVCGMILAMCVSIAATAMAVAVYLPLRVGDKIASAGQRHKTYV